MIIRKFLFWLLMLQLVVPLQAQSIFEKAKDTSAIRVGIAVSAHPLMRLINPAFAAKYPDVHFNSMVEQTSVVVDSVISGYASVAITTRTIKDYEKQKEPTLMGTPIGLDGFIVTVAKSNPVTSLTFDQVVGIYTGTITNWKEVGGKDLPIIVIGRNKGYDPINLFADFMQMDTKLVTDGVLYSIKGKESWSKISVPAPATNEAALALLNISENTVTYFPLQVLNEYKSAGLNVKALAFNGIEATYHSIEDGSYFIHRKLNAITKGKPVHTIQLLIDFLLSASGQQLINEAGFLSLKNN